MLAAAQSPPSPPQQRFSPAHRHLALLRTADWRQSVATPHPTPTEKQYTRSPVIEGVCMNFPYIQKNRFLQSRPTRRLKDCGGKCERRAENQTGCPAPHRNPSSSISVSSLLLRCLCCFLRAPGSPTLNIPSD